MTLSGSEPNHVVRIVGGRKHWSRVTTRQRLVTSSLATFGSLWLVVEPLGLFLPGKLDWGLTGYIVMLVLSVAVGFYRALPKYEFEHRLGENDVLIRVRTDDVLSASGNLIIGTNDCFDTELGDIISPNSVQGQLLINVFSSNRQELDQAIDTALADVTYSTDPLKKQGKSNRYALGTIARVKRGNSTYFLLAFCRMTPEFRVETTANELWNALASCWSQVRTYGNHQTVSLPILGAGFARLGLSKTLLLQLIILSFLVSLRDGTTSPQIDVYIHPKDAPDLDFIALKRWLQGLAGVQ